MRLLFDEQLSEELVTAVRDLFPASLHVRLLGKGGAADPVVWQLAAEHGCVLVTKDEDFHRLSVLHGAPPKVVWLRLGNCATADIARLLRDHVDDLRSSRHRPRSHSWNSVSHAEQTAQHAVAAVGGWCDHEPPRLNRSGWTDKIGAGPRDTIRLVRFTRLTRLIHRERTSWES